MSYDDQDSYNISEARKLFSQICNTLSENPQKGAIRITRNGKPGVVIMSSELFDALIETVEIISNPQLMKELRKSIHEAEEGNLIPIEDIEEEFGL